MGSSCSRGESGCACLSHPTCSIRLHISHPHTSVRQSLRHREGQSIPTTMEEHLLSDGRVKFSLYLSKNEDLPSCSEES